MIDPDWIPVDPPIEIKDHTDGIYPIYEPRDALPPITAGMLLRLEVDGGEDGETTVVERLVGHVNENGGVCNCCGFESGRLIAYRRVWEP